MCNNRIDLTVSNVGSSSRIKHWSNPKILSMAERSKAVSAAMQLKFALRRALRSSPQPSFTLQEEEMMKPFDKCPICRSELVEKDVEKILRGGNHTAVVTVYAEVCLHCGERLYSEEQVRLFEQIRNKLANGQTQEYKHVGKSYHVPLSQF